MPGRFNKLPEEDFRGKLMSSNGGDYKYTSEGYRRTLRVWVNLSGEQEVLLISPEIESINTRKPHPQTSLLLSHLLPPEPGRQSALWI